MYRVYIDNFKKSFYAKNFRSYDFRNYWYATGKSILVISSLVELLFTPIKAYFVPVGSSSFGPYCSNIRSISLYCLGGETHLEVKKWIHIILLIIILSGTYPRYAGIMQLWLTYSLSLTMSLPDGGDSISLIVLLILVPFEIFDSRKNIWKKPTKSLSPNIKSILFCFSWYLRIQLSFIYLVAAIAKMGRTHWQEGTSFYYITRDLLFGDKGIASPITWSITQNSWGTLILSWVGGIIIEIFIAALLLMNHNKRLIALSLDIGLSCVYVTH